MVAYPTSLPIPNNIEEAFNKPLNQSKSIGGYSISFGRGTNLNKSWKVYYSFLTDNDKVILETFFNTYVGQAFTWVHPDSASYNVIFSVNNIAFRRIYVNRWSTQLSIVESPI